MNKLIGLVLAAVLAAAGCGTTEQSYMADTPPPIVRGDPATTTVDPVHLSAGHGRLTADEIDEDNYSEYIKQLESEIRSEKAMSKLGK